MRIRLPLVAMLALVACQPYGNDVVILTFPATASPTAPTSSSTAPGGTGALAGWRTFAPIPTARSEVASAIALGQVFVIGGFGGGRVTEAYDPASDRWTRRADLPLSLNHTMAAASGEAVYLAGGYLDSGQAVERVFVLGRGDDAWHEVARMPEPRGAGGAAALGDVVYVVGGARDGRLLPSAYAYDRVANAWRRIADLPTPRDHLAVVAFGGRVCAVGGRRIAMSENLGAFECYTPATDRWDKLPDLPTPRGGLGAAVVRGSLYVAGGERPSGTYREVEAFDGSRWMRAPDLPTPRHGLAVVSLNDTLYVIAGGPTPGGSQTNVNEALAPK